MRFYPAPHPEPLSTGSGVHAQNAGAVAAALEAKRPQQALERMRESITIWTPLYDRAIGLFLETVEGEPPTLQRTAAGELRRGPTGNPIVIGGWPCRRYPPDWPGRARAWLDECRSLRATHTLCGKPDDPKANFARLRHYLERCANDPAALGPRDVGMIRRILGTFVGRHGAPDSVRRLAARSTQRHTVSAPAHAALARQVAARLRGYPPYAGVAELERVLSQLTAARPLPASIERKARRCLEAPLGELVSRGVISSSRELAQLLPIAAARDRAKAIDDPALRRLFEACHIAFRAERARSVHFGELPWIDALTPWVGTDADSRAAARATSVDALAGALSAFPHAPLPNELVRELRALAVTAGLALTLVDAPRAGSFPSDSVEAYARAAERASHYLHGTLYARYYELPGSSPPASGWIALCHERARHVLPNASETGLHGALLEQAQILTTHNLAPVFEQLELAAQLRLPELARATFEWIGRELQRPLKDWRAQQQVLLDTAAAWRQLIFYLSLGSRDELETFLSWTEQSSARRKPRFGERVAPVLAGLRAIAAGAAFDAHGLHEPSGGRRFVGSTEGTHWLLRPRGGATSRAKR